MCEARSEVNMQEEKIFQNLRQTGIEFIKDIPWGTHICGFYQTKKDLVDILVPYFKNCLENNEYCMWIVSEPISVNEAEQALRDSIPTGFEIQEIFCLDSLIQRRGYCEL
jgi:hypothetical protein